MKSVVPHSPALGGPLARRLEALHGYFAVVVLLTGAAVLVGWATDNARLRTVVPGMVSMKVNTALGLMLLAAALLGINRPGRAWRAAVRGCLAAAAGVAGLTLAEYVFGVDLRIDTLFVADFGSVRFPGRPAPATVAALLGIAAGLGLLHAGRAGGVAQSLLLVVAAAPLTTLGGYLYGTPGLYRNAGYPVIALHTSVALMLVCLGGLCARADEALVGIIASSSMAGSVARKLLPAAVGLPLLTGLLVLAGERAGVYTAAFGSALLVACCVAFFAAAVCWTVTLLWRAERSRAEAEAELRTADERAARLKDEFLSVVSHELRTPLNAILGWSQLLRAGPDADELAEGLGTIERNARAQVRIIEDLLDMGRIAGGRIRLDVRPLDLAALVEAAVRTLRPAAEAKGVRVEQALDPQAAPYDGDAGRLQQVVANLLGNAVKFTPAGGHVRVALGRTAGGVRVVVSDTGDGIPPEFLPDLFGRFRQADASTTRRHGGLGLGLSIARQLVELHGGSVHAHSAGRGHGSTFTVTLPAPPASPGPPPVRPSTGPAGPVGPVEGPRLGGLRVLVVDDEPDARELVRRVLHGSAADVRVAASAAEAMAVLAATPVDVLVSDIGMPGENGYTLIGRVRGLDAARGAAAGPDGGKRVAAVALSAYAREEDRAAAIAAGFDGCLAKPVEPAELLAAVARAGGRTTARPGGRPDAVPAGPPA